MVKLGSRILLVLALLWSLGAGTPTQYTSLDLTNVPQQLSNWCWAATAAMAKNAVGATPALDQCQEANTQGLTCCPVPQKGDPARKLCNHVGFPKFEPPDYEAQVSSSALSWADIKKEINAQRPFIYMRHQAIGGGHFLVVQGYSRDQGVRSILLNDPAPVNSGAVYWQTYSWYSDAATHVQDQYGIKYHHQGN